MHPNPLFRCDDHVVQDALIEEIGFGMICAATPAGLRVAHAPLVSTGHGSIRFHLARANALTPHLAGSTALAVINGPDAYVSPRWYADKGHVPTWNYVAVELEGVVRAVGEEDLVGLLAAIGERHEARIAQGSPWLPAHVPQDRWDVLIQAIQGFELEIRVRRSTLKLSQNKPAQDRQVIAEALEKQGAPAIAAIMRKETE